MRLASIVALTAIAIAGVVAGVLVLNGTDMVGHMQSTVEHPVAIPAAERTVGISRTMPMPSAHARHLSAMLEQGAMPHRATMADVMSDTDCTPDAQMISHCRNVVRLESGREIVLRHPHDMRSIPCLAPGERVLLVPSGA